MTTSLTCPDRNLDQITLGAFFPSISGLVSFNYTTSFLSIVLTNFVWFGKLSLIASSSWICFWLVGMLNDLDWSDFIIYSPIWLLVLLPGRLKKMCRVMIMDLGSGTRRSVWVLALPIFSYVISYLPFLFFTCKIRFTLVPNSEDMGINELIYLKCLIFWYIVNVNCYFLSFDIINLKLILSIWILKFCQKFNFQDLFVCFSVPSVYSLLLFYGYSVHMFEHFLSLAQQNSLSSPCTFPCPRSGTSHFSKEPWYLFWG